MKYVYILGGLALAALLGWTYFQNGDNSSLQENTLVATVSKTATIMPLSADVSLGSLDTWSVIATTTSAADGTKVKTSAEGRAIVSVETDILSSLDNNSEITLSLSPEKKQSQVALIAGSIWSKVARALEQDEVFEVYTPTMVAAVRGTSFGVSMDPKRNLVVTEGTVWITRRNPITGERIANSTVEVTAGNTVEDDGTNFLIRPITPDDRDEWYYLNNPKPDANGAVSILDQFVPTVVTETTSTPESTSNGPTPTIRAADTPVISSVSPTRFDPRILDKVRVYGENLQKVTVVRLNTVPVEFAVTSTGVIVINTSEFRDGYEGYDISVTSSGGTATERDAFVLEVEGIDLAITNTSFIYDQSQVSYIYVRGPGMGQVDTVFINKQSSSFEIMSDTELRVSYPFLETTMSVEVSVGDQSAQGSVSP